MIVLLAVTRNSKRRNSVRSRFHSCRACRACRAHAPFHSRCLSAKSEHYSRRFPRVRKRTRSSARAPNRNAEADGSETGCRSERWTFVALGHVPLRSRIRAQEDSHGSNESDRAFPEFLLLSRSPAIIGLTCDLSPPSFPLPPAASLCGSREGFPGSALHHPRESIGFAARERGGGRERERERAVGQTSSVFDPGVATRGRNRGKRRRLEGTRETTPDDPSALFLTSQQGGGRGRDGGGGGREEGERERRG